MTKKLDSFDKRELQKLRRALAKADKAHKDLGEIKQLLWGTSARGATADLIDITLRSARAASDAIGIDLMNRERGK